MCQLLRKQHGQKGVGDPEQGYCIIWFWAASMLWQATLPRWVGWAKPQQCREQEEKNQRKIVSNCHQSVHNWSCLPTRRKKKKSLSWMTGCNVWRLEMGLWALKRLSKEKGTEETTSKAVLSFSGNKMAGGKRRCTWTFCVFTVCLSESLAPSS